MILFATTILDGNDDLYVEKIHYSFIQFIWLLVNDSVRELTGKVCIGV